MNVHKENVVQARLDAILYGKEVVELHLFGEDGQPVGLMSPLTECHIDKMDLIEKMTDWRNENMAKFLTHFEATTARTRSWIENILLKKPGQMLWLIYDQENRLVGHFGFKNLTVNSVLLDNAIRGERHGHPKLFVFAGKSLVKWLWENTFVSRIDGVVMADNVSAIMMNRQIGFQGWKRHPLIKRVIQDTIHWHTGEEGGNSPDGHYCFNIFIERVSNTLPSD